jgi:RHS repeat-associated protein
MQRSRRAPITALPQPSRLLRFLCSTIFVIAAAMAAAAPSRAQQSTPYSINPGDSTPPVVTITPTSESVSANTLAVTIDWCDDNTLSATSRQITLRGTNVTSSFSYTTSNKAGCKVHASSSGTVTLITGNNYLSASIKDGAGNLGQNSATYTYTAAVYGVQVTPKGGDTAVVVANQTDTTRLIVENTGSDTATFALTAACTGPAFLSGCSVSPTSMRLAANGSQTALVIWSGAVDSTRGTAVVTAQQTLPSSPATVDSGWVVVRESSSGGAPCATSLSSIAPCTFSVNAFTGQNSLTETYTIRSFNHLEGVSYGLHAAISGAVVWDSVAQSVFVGRDSSAHVTVYYHTGSTPGTGTVALTADDGQTPVTGVVTVHVSTPPPPPPFTAIAVSPHATSLGMDPGAAGVEHFVITNSSTDTATIQFTRACTGAAIAGGCTPTADSVRLAPGAAASENVSFTASTTAAATGQIRFTAWRSDTTTARDSGVVAVSVVRDSSVVDVASVNSGATTDRASCLAVSFGWSASDVCGDLRLTWALPETQTLTTARAPVLLYDSRTAAPYVSIAANITLPTGGSIPDQVSLRLLDSAGVVLDSAAWAGSNWSAASTRRVVLQFDPVAMRNYPTGAYRYVLEVARIQGGVATRDTVSGSFVVVRRDQSQFGPGWWLAGFERLYFGPGENTMFWVGGDGSTRMYTRSPTNPNVWGAPSLDWPDSLRRAGARFIRDLPHGLKVQFDTIAGCHMETVNRLGQTTAFSYLDAQCGRLSTITLPPSSAGKAYTFSYTSVNGAWRLQRVDAPAVGGQARFDSLAYNASGQLTRFRDVYGDTVGLRYRAATDARVSTLVDPRGDTLSFVWATTEPGPLAQAVTPLASGATAVTAVTASAMRGLQGSPALPLEEAYARLDGPRTDVGDTTLVWTDARGAPMRTRDALGDETLIARGNSAYPGAVTRVQSPSGQVLAATYDARGHLATVTDSSHWRGSLPVYATTQYTWDGTWDFVTRTIAPEGDSTTAAYDPATGNMLWARDGAGHQTTFAYYPSGTAAGLLRSVQSPTLDRDSLVYDATLGNLARTIAPLGDAHAMARDDAGRVVADTVPNDSTTGFHVTRQWLDLLGRDTLSVDSAGAQALRVRQRFDRAGNVDTVETWSTPDPNAIGTITRVFTYDRAGRTTQEQQVGFPAITWTYDAAGNLTAGGRRPTNNTYDALNRRTLAAAAHDTARYGYDALGRLLYANNPYARVRRAWAADGALVADTLRIATADSTVGDFSQHVYGLEMGSDLDGRRTWLRYPGTLAVAGQDSVAYSYDARTGALVAVRDLFGNLFQYRYDADGRLAGDTRFAQGPDSVSETRSYDGDGRLVRRVERFLASPLHSDSLHYSRTGRVLKNVGTGDSLAYSPFGALRFAQYATASGPEQMVSDALGNHVSMWVPATTYALHQYQYVPGSNELRLGLLPSTPTDTTYYYTGVYEAMGEQLDVHRFTWQGTVGFGREERDLINAYNGQQQLVRARFVSDSTAQQQLWGRYQRIEYFRYDALGRRVWQRLVRDTGFACTNHDQLSGCKNTLTRTVWDGDQVLYEIRAVGDTTGLAQESDATSGALYGPVGYVHGLGLDAPLLVFKQHNAIGLAYTWRGEPDMGICGASTCSPTTIQFPLAQASSYGDAPPAVPTAYWGGLITGERDASGYEYKRNRYYDPESGRFTQEDPIGLAGGLNLYGYAAGDPVSYADPFGLCPPKTMAEVFMCTGQLLQPAQLPLEIAGMLAIAPLGGDMGMMGKALAWGTSAGRAAGAAQASASAAIVTDRVIGSYGESGTYLQVGEAIGAKTFNIPMSIWSKMSAAARWAANQKFLDRGIAEGAEFVLSTYPTEITRGTDLAKEVTYLLDHGYTWSSNGLSLIPK